MNGPALLAMPMMTLAEAALATGGAATVPGLVFSGVTTDSRRIVPGDLFVALAGERFDGHDYVAAAMRGGAAAALVSRPVVDGGTIPQVLVTDTRAALGRLAAAWRARFALPLAALTGSNGKTTVKEMAAAILAAHCGGRADVLATEGNLNNDIGLPLTLLRLREHHRFGVLEMGMNHAGEIDYLSRLAVPRVALVNNAQRAHVGLLGGVEAVARAKGEIYAGLEPGGVALVNADDAFAGHWRDLAGGHRVVSFGMAASADVRGMPGEGGEFRIVTPADAFAVRLQVPGEHNARNALAAAALAFALDIPWQALQAGLEDFRGAPGRLERKRSAAGTVLIDDTYNANPDSMRAAIRVLAAEPGRRALVMGDMGELGESEGTLHAEVGAFAREAGIDAILCLGAQSRRAAEAFGAGAACFDDLATLVHAARAEAGKGATLLVKGSRFMRMERVVEALQPEDGHAA